jgi:Protein of unknown function (DUF3034)
MSTSPLVFVNPAASIYLTHCRIPDLAVGYLANLFRGHAVINSRAALIASITLSLGFLTIGPSAQAQRAPYESALVPDLGKLPLTAGFTNVDGAGGGGLVPWATISGYGTDTSWGANAHYTVIPLNDFRFQSYGVTVGAIDRIEASATHDEFRATGGALNGAKIEQQVFGAKLRLTGDALYDQDSWVPQTAVGVEYKHNTGISGLGGLTDPLQVGALGDSSTDFYVSATKIFLAQSLLLNITLRYTKANQLGILGFGGDLNHSRKVQPEATVAYLITRKLAIGAEYRTEPRNLTVDDQRAAWDAFVAWTITRNFSVVAGYANLGSILAPVTQDSRSQSGAYLSLQAGF